MEGGPPAGLTHPVRVGDPGRGRGAVRPLLGRETVRVSKALWGRRAVGRVHRGRGLGVGPAVRVRRAGRARGPVALGRLAPLLGVTEPLGGGGTVAMPGSRRLAIALSLGGRQPSSPGRRCGRRRGRRCGHRRRLPSRFAALAGGFHLGSHGSPGRSAPRPFQDRTEGALAVSPAIFARRGWRDLTARLPSGGGRGCRRSVRLAIGALGGVRCPVRLPGRCLRSRRRRG